MATDECRLSDEEVRTLIALLDRASAVMNNLSRHPKLDAHAFHWRLPYIHGARDLADAGALVRGLVFKLTEGEPIVT